MCGSQSCDLVTNVVVQTHQFFNLAKSQFNLVPTAANFTFYYNHNKNVINIKFL